LLEVISKKEVVPVETQPSIICGDNKCNKLESPEDCPQDCYVDPTVKNSNNLVYPLFSF